MYSLLFSFRIFIFCLYLYFFVLDCMFGFPPFYTFEDIKNSCTLYELDNDGMKKDKYYPSPDPVL